MLALLVIFTVVLAPAACDYAVTEEPEPEAEQLQVVTVWDGPKTFNPLLNWSAGKLDTVTGLVHGTLFSITAGGDLQPFLAEEMSADGDTVTFTLRTDLKWHDGEAVTAEDIAFFLRVLLHPNFSGVDPGDEFDFVHGVEAYRQGEADGIAGVSVDDDTTIRFRVDPGGGIWNLLFLSPAPAHLHGDVNPADLEDVLRGQPPVGCGPYVFEGAEEEEHGTLVTLTRFDGFPLIDDDQDDASRHLQILVAAGAEAFSGERHHVLYAPGWAEAEEVEGFSSEVLPAEGFEYLGLNLRNPILAHPEVRRAINLAVDRGARAEDMFGAGGQPVGGPVPWEVGETPPVAHDPAQARRILSNAGFLADDDGWLHAPEEGAVHLRLAYPAGDEGRERTASGIAADLAGVGLKVTPVGVERDLFIYNIYGRRRFDMYLLAMPWRMSTSPGTWGGDNVWGYEGLPKLTGEASWAQTVAEDMPVVFLFAPRMILLVADGIHCPAVSGIPPLGDLFLWKWDAEAGN